MFDKLISMARRAGRRPIAWCLLLALVVLGGSYGLPYGYYHGMYWLFHKDNRPIFHDYVMGGRLPFGGWILASAKHWDGAGNLFLADPEVDVFAIVVSAGRDGVTLSSGGGDKSIIRLSEPEPSRLYVVDGESGRVVETVVIDADAVSGLRAMVERAGDAKEQLTIHGFIFVEELSRWAERHGHGEVTENINRIVEQAAESSR